jgi:hypothetical protein
MEGETKKIVQRKQVSEEMRIKLKLSQREFVIRKCSYFWLHGKSNRKYIYLWSRVTRHRTGK